MMRWDLLMPMMQRWDDLMNDGMIWWLQIAQIIEPIMTNAQISHRRWGILNDSMMINGANPEINNNKCANPSSEMGSISRKSAYYPRKSQLFYRQTRDLVFGNGFYSSQIAILSAQIANDVIIKRKCIFGNGGIFHDSMMRFINTNDAKMRWFDEW